MAILLLHPVDNSCMAEWKRKIFDSHYFFLGAEHVPEAEPTEECISQSEVVPTGDLCCPGDACADNGICLTRCCSPWNAMPDNTAECNESGWTKTCKEGFEYVKGIGCTTPSP